MIRNNLHWTHYIREVFVPELTTFSEYFLREVIPVFENLEVESGKIEQEEFTRLGEITDPDSFDMGGITEIARDRAVSYYLLRKQLFQGIINLFAAGLYHMFEQQLFMFHRKELLTKDEEDKTNLIKMCEVAELLRKSNIDISSFSS